MGTGISGLYSNTSGDKRIKEQLSRKDKAKKTYMRRKITVWAMREKEKLSKISKQKRNEFNTACIIYDISTGKFYYGKNKGISLNNSPKNSILFGDSNSSGILPKKSLNNYSVGNCAEVDAINNALNDGAKLKNLYMTVIHTNDNKFGIYKKSCKNCTYAFKGKIKLNHSKWEGTK